MRLEVALDNGAMNSEVILNAGKKIFKKSLNVMNNSSIKKIENKLFSYALNSLPYNQHRQIAENGNNLLKKEVFTWYKWRNEGIPTLNFEEISDNSISWEYVQDSQSLKQYFNQRDSLKTFDNFIDLYSFIRNKALKSKDKMYFHSDPHLGNFLIDSKNKIIPIDSGCILNDKMSLDELDFHLLKQTLLSVSNLETSNETKVEYVKSFNEMLSDKKREQFLSWDYSISPFVRGYFAFRESALSFVKGKKRPNLFSQYDNFVSFFNSDIREIFSK